jgi:predicted  nucleic acid-binding Zn-ribbon protein
MTDMSQVITLFRLQKIDTRRDHIALRLGEIEKILSEDLALLQAQNQQVETEQVLQQKRKSLNHAEDAVQAQMTKIEQADTALYGGRIRNPKELQDLQNDVRSLKRYLATLEDEQLEAMVALEDTETQLQTATTALQLAEAKSEGQHATLVAEKTALLKEREKLDAERQAAIGAISEDTLKIYERLRLQRRGVAVAAVVDRACEACGVTLSPAEWQIARSPTQITYCSTCGRILYAG